LIIERLLKVCHTKELNNCHGAINCLIALSSIIPSSYYNSHFFDILETVFHVIQKIPEVIQITMFDNCLELLRIIAGFYPELSKTNGFRLYSVCDSLVTQLLSANENQHEAAKFFLKQISKYADIKIPLLFFEPERGLSQLSQMKYEGEVQLNFNKSDLARENLPISKIIQLQDKIFSELSSEKIQKDNPRYLKMLRNSIETMNLLISEKILPYKFVDEKEYTLTQDFKHIINLFDRVIEENDKIYKPYVYIIAQSQYNPPPNPNQPGPSGSYHRPEGMDEERKDQPHVQPQPQPQTQVTQNYTINRNILYDDDEFNVNIEDVDLNIKNWSKLISSFLYLMQNLITHKTVHTVIKSRISRKGENSGITAEINDTRNKIIFRFFDMMLRIERGIRKAASKGLRTLIRLEHQPKDLLTEDKLKVILRPILICLQQDYYKFNIPFLQVLRKLVKYLSQCFNKTLSDKLVEHLTRFMEFLCSGNRNRPGQHEIVVDERKIASGIFYLFEHLPHASQYVDLIIKLNTKIDNYIVNLSGLSCMNYLMRRPLLRIVNCFASGSVELFLTNLQDYWRIFLYILKADCSHPIRERLTRETQSFLERTFNDQVLVILSF